MKIINCIINKFKKKKMTKGSIGKSIKLVKTSVKNKPSSNNNNIGSCGTFKITSQYDAGNGYSGWIIATTTGENKGWVYDYEIEGTITKEDIKKEIESLECQLNDERLKLSWMEEVGVEEYDEDQIKVYKTLKLLEDDKVSLVDKSKLIAELIKGSDC
jgi:hypothetical protein